MLEQIFVLADCGNKEVGNNMAVNIEALKAKIKALQGEKRNSDIQLWKPGVGEYRIRIVPWSDLDDGNFAKELWFYYLEGQRATLTTEQFGQPDPIADLRKKLFSTKKDDDRNLAKTLMPKMRVYSAIIVRGQEEAGVQIWSYGKQTYQDMLNILTDDDYGDITDVEEGFDLKVNISKDPKKNFNDTRITPARKSSPLTEDATLKEKWLKTPNLFDIYQKKTPDQIKMVLESYLNPEAKEADLGTARGRDVADVAEEIKATVKSAKAEEKQSISVAKKEAAPQKVQSLDEAFAELEADEEDED